VSSGYKPLAVAVFLVIAAIIAKTAFIPGKAGIVQVYSSLEGGGVAGSSPIDRSPVLISVAQGAEMVDSAALVQNEGADTFVFANDGGAEATNVDSSNGAIQDPGQPISSPVVSIVSANSNSGKTTSTLPNFNRDFIIPAQGYDWGILHNYNAVDIANSCGTPVVAAADGIVVPDPNIPDVAGGWNGGYGNFVLIEHSFGTGIYTRYAHLSQILVQIGDLVKQGQEIGLMGESGEATGCHVHFEVIGAQNPFAK
jgi:murein DD-endopeptidase MepM/ murein hydrolase activator NlpD